MVEEKEKEEKEEEKLTCVICGDTYDYTSKDISAVNEGSTLEKEMNLDSDQLHENGFYPVCSEYYDSYC